MAYSSLDLWLLGYPDQALQRSQDVLALAQRISHPFNLAFACSFAALLRHLRREDHLVLAQAETALKLAQEKGFSQWLAYGTILRAWALIQQGQKTTEPLAQMRQALAGWQSTGAKLGLPYFLLLLAEAYHHVGQIETGLTVLTEAITEATQNADRWAEAELYRLRGALLLSQDQIQAEEYFHQALDIARRQQAKAWELRSVMSLSRLWQQQGKRGEARLLLVETYNWFTEGFDTPDLSAARELLTAFR